MKPITVIPYIIDLYKIRDENKGKIRFLWK